MCDSLSAAYDPKLFGGPTFLLLKGYTYSSCGSNSGYPRVTPVLKGFIPKELPEVAFDPRCANPIPGRPGNMFLKESAKPSKTNNEA